MTLVGTNEVIKKLAGWEERQRAAAVALAGMWAGKLESEAKSQAGWVDRTGNARNGIFGSTQVVDGEIKIRVSHTMEYGVFLELANEGKHAILQPTIDGLTAAILDNYRRLWE